MKLINVIDYNVKTQPMPHHTNKHLMTALLKQEVASTVWVKDSFTVPSNRGRIRKALKWAGIALLVTLYLSHAFTAWGWI